MIHVKLKNYFNIYNIVELYGFSYRLVTDNLFWKLKNAHNSDNIGPRVCTREWQVKIGKEGKHFVQGLKKVNTYQSKILTFCFRNQGNMNR